MLQTPIEFKSSNFSLLVIYIYHSQPDIIRQALQDKINQAEEFLRNAPVVVNISALNSSTVNWQQIQKAIDSTGLHIVGISGCKNKELKKIIKDTGLSIISEGKNINRINHSALVDITAYSTKKVKSKTYIVNTLVRSGQKIYSKNADLIVTNNVSTGAELVADGNIHIYGIMRGRALAGASGDNTSQIFCTNLFAELVSISGEYWIMDQIPSNFFGKAVRLFLKDGSLTIQKLN